MGPLHAALDLADPRPETGIQAQKKNYAERLSRAIATVVANALRKDFPGITPDAEGGRQEAPARTSKGLKKLDVNYRTASRYLAELAKGKVLREHYVGKYHLFINKPLLDLLKK